MGLPFLQLRMGLAPKPLAARHITADFSWPKADRRREFIRVRQKTDDQGHISLDRWPNQGSGVMSSVAWADGLVDIAPGQTIEPGDAVPYLSLADLLGAVQ